VFKLKQEVSDETVYHDALNYPVDEEQDEINDDDGGGEGNDADNDQESPAAHDNRCVNRKILKFCVYNFFSFLDIHL
jgi:hypothetical protein